MTWALPTVTQHEVIKVTFFIVCTMHSFCSAAARHLLTEPVSLPIYQPPETHSFQLLCGNSFSNFCAMCPLSRYKLNFFITKTLSSVPHGMFTYENTWRFIIAGPLGYCHQTIESVSRNWWNLSAMYIKLWYQNSKYFLLHPKMISIKCAKHRVVKNQLGQRDKCQWKST